MADAARRWFRRLLIWPLALVLLIALYYAIGGHFAHSIDDDPRFAADVVTPDGGSATVAVVAALMTREVDTNGWVANDPMIFPSHFLDDMANYQRALIGASRRMLADVATWIEDGVEPPSLEEARAELAMPGDRWAFDLSTSWRPQPTTEQAYRASVAALERFNAEISSGSVTLAYAPMSFAATLNRFASELDDAVATAHAHVDAHGGKWLNTSADDLFMRTKGLLYAQHALLEGLAHDFQTTVSAPNAAGAVSDAQAALEAGLELGPWLVLNGDADGQFRPSHLSAQAAFAQRAAEALRLLARTIDGGTT